MISEESGRSPVSQNHLVAHAWDYSLATTQFLSKYPKLLTSMKVMSVNPKSIDTVVVQIIT